MRSPLVDKPVTTVSLRFRVVVSVVAVLAAVLVALGLVVSSLLGKALRTDLEQRLEDRAGYAVVLQERGITGQTLADALTGGGVFSTFTADGRQYVGDEENNTIGRPRPGGPFGAGQRPTLPQPSAEPTVSFAEADGMLTATVELRDGTLALQIGENEIQRTLSVLRTIEIIAGAIALALAAGLLTLVVGLALRPLRTMTDLARRIGAGDRGRRLRPTRPNTELGRTAAAFDDMLDSLESAERSAQQAEDRMRHFLADASHDLRTPLAGVIAGADSLLRADQDTLDRAEREERLVLIVRQARRAARLVDDLLVMARLDGAVENATTTVDLAELARNEVDALELRRPDLPPPHLVAAPTPVQADPDELRRAITNLLDNAAAVTPPGGRVRVSVGHDGRQAVAVIDDDGPGVAEGDRERIFDRFVRLTESRSTPGSGLGLPISRAIARRGGGDLVCVARPDGRPGARFEFRLPVAPVRELVGA
ncbi:HAMP domain-containing protein [Nakamurella sp. YIM 132087]|uniref:histidine kinase n=1 Tax=Nakamurella alba TaxID=2665158 RepID=A0A7K1FM08_9ACTN|nr:HAMP domain-containing sensor histidine kinase [Nakamurella alba]MTD15192.1 HAMP domain-containing protein [Nakamurella alba]